MVTTLVLASYRFDNGPSCLTQGWTTVDLTAQAGDYWHVDDFTVSHWAGTRSAGHITFNPIQGAKSMWLGVEPPPANPVNTILCQYLSLPGYGNGWNQAFCTKNCLAIAGGATVGLDLGFKIKATEGTRKFLAKYGVLCEKPIATTHEDAKAIVDVCNKAGVILMTAFPMRFSAPLAEIKARLYNGDFGDVYCFNATNQGELPTKHRAWFVDPELAGGGAIMDHTVHLVDIMRWFIGSEVETMYARSNRIFHADEVQVETGALEMLTFKNNVFATIDASWCRPQYWPTWGGLTFEMVTQRGAVFVDAFRQNVNIYSHDAQRANWAYWGSDMNHAMVSEFASAVRGNREPKVTGVDDLRAGHNLI